MSFYAAAGATFGTVTAGAGAPAAILACNSQQGACMIGCAGAAAGALALAGPAAVLAVPLGLIGALAAVISYALGKFGYRK